MCNDFCTVSKELLFNCNTRGKPSFASPIGLDTGRLI